MTPAGLINTAARPHFEQIIEGDKLIYQCDLAAMADKLLLDIFTTLHREHRFAQAMQAGNPSVPMVERLRLRNQIQAALTMAGVFVHDIEAADMKDLDANVYEATTEPPWCDCDTAYATRPDGLCDNCGNTADAAQANISQIRAV